MSQVHPPPSMMVTTDILKNVKCGACDKYLSYFPIYIQDQTSICGRCSEHLLTKDQPRLTNTAYERLAQSVKFPCIYDVEGCLEYLYPADIPNHEKICPRRIICCPLEECVWQGTVVELLDHFRESHQQAIIQDGEFEVNFLNSYESYSLVLYNDELFSFKQKFDHSAGLLEYSFYCYKANDPITQYQYEIIVLNGNRNLSIKLPPKSAENFQEENVTEISVQDIKTKLKDPSVIIGTVKIFTEGDNNMTPDEKPKKNNPEINIEMLTELECPVCFDYIAPPIFQCVTGHSICSECKTKVMQCPTCKGEIKNTQNFTLEKMAYFLTYPCKFSEFGCDFASKPNKIKEHQKFCSHGPHWCPLRDYERSCSWKDSAKNMYNHVLGEHHDNILDIDSIRIFIDGNYFAGDDTNCYILKFSDALFKLHYRYDNECFYWAMQLMGPADEAKKYKFEIDIMDESNNNQRFFLRSFCSSISDKEEAFQDTSDYVFVQLKQIRAFITDIFTYRVHILK